MPIRELPRNVSSKIAAGEVVERPVSVVKELIENSIDAGATEIQIRIKDAGRTLIEVSDNGEGIPAGEAAIALKRYATSKISSASDLESIGTLGFRGEALASIAAVSRFRLETLYADESQGVAIGMDGGSRMEESVIGRNRGTKVQVGDLFFTVPARRKFLKKDITEKRQISELVSLYGLYYSQIRFSLTSDGRDFFTTYGRNDRREILSEIFDLDTARRLLEVDQRSAKIHVEGFISPTGITRSNRRDISFFVNGRLVSDPALTSAVLRAYHGFLMTGRFPIAHIFITIPPEELDVNVHPTKAEIRFREPGLVFSAVHGAVRKTISAFSPVPAFSPKIWNSVDPQLPTSRQAWTVAPQPNGSSGFENTEKPGGENAQPMEAVVPLLRVIGQLGGTYIAAEGPDGLYLIDQHAAHERILFENMSSSGDQAQTAQMLLEPAVVQLNSTLMDEYGMQKDLLDAIGFKTAEFGPGSIRIEALPVVIQQMDPREALRAALDADEDEQNVVDQSKEIKLISKICKRAAVKGGQILSQMEQEKLVRDLEKCKSPRTCPHGRPTMIHLSVDLLARQFGRLGSR